MLHTYKFTNGDTVTSTLDKDELLKRMNRLDQLRVLCEQHDCKEGRNITRKAIAAYNKLDNFTGIIRLSVLEKDWLSYMLESDFLSDYDRTVINWYIKRS